MTSKVYVALRVKATPERAFAAFVGEIGAWWRPSPLFETTPRPGVLSFELPDGEGEGGRLIETRAGGKVFEIGRITAWEPPARLVFTWRQANFPLDLTTEVEVGFEAVGEETRVSIEHRGFDRVPSGAARHGFPDQVLLMRLADFWRAQIVALGERTR
ncbi:SRPBCC domain-containing protein [Phenylobacterium sp.]|uniref:SRPBCC domain-containing protein n=1 Tax=Phenylobacterium sp. TaxID=1871053 RepID=UPI002B77EAEC|nr:SRPBCC domain-containing protein [Phenylobacterium sp.]HLZ77552.1 SRPBCC domain-containing protein [Phenylobacterium sp.]